MSANIPANRTVEFALRALQLIFAIIVMGTDGYAIHVYRGHTDYVHFVFGNFYAYAGVPDEWGFLMFCAGWTFLGVIFLFLTAGISFAEHALIGSISVIVEVVALLSWLAGFIAVAINIGSNACPAEENQCRLLKAAIVFGALEWLLFMITTIPTIKVVFNSTRRSKTSTTDPTTPV
ncbi:hypothetical protein BO78DRAFT_457959 [Aspergillus sclerotiicarbonarius CBS 121057]|uniref:MARVEL domain-containing protein n=1 Tax=Aspergillus sclerotiicarbonarius (strain CBS 121057 / IBT 28362) TaxID=1448318 RepID=A0A319ESV8_ASPSB|nr:hypothetical protein BO78DRAFT_457959 [Aspergillus sclerotiicarbonarius CBS 121057]